MSHKARCIRSDGDWMCEGGCTHDRDEIVLQLVTSAQEVDDLYREDLIYGNEAGRAALRKLSVALVRSSRLIGGK